MLRIFKDNFVPKYKSGKWIFDPTTEKFKFIGKDIGKPEPETVLPIPNQLSLYKFKDNIDQVEELIFRKEFSRDRNSVDHDFITIQDLKNLVLFLAPSELIRDDFIDFIHTQTLDKFFNALIIYFEYFLKIVEFLLIRRDEMNDKYAKIQGLESVEMKKMLSEYLAQYRLLVAREYSKIILGTHDVFPFHHIPPLVNLSRTIHDRFFHEAFMAFTTQMVWIAMHRRAYNTIDNEMNRLFRSGHFNVTEIGTKPSDYIQFSKIEEQVLYGMNDKRSNFRAQNSPLIQEISCVAQRNLPILWIGEKKYRGTDKRIYELEMEFIIPDSQLFYADIVHGILGHPKMYYDTMLAIDWTVVRLKNYSVEYDPYNLYRSPNIKLPDYDTFIKRKQYFTPLFEVKDVRYEWKKKIENIKYIWKNRDRTIKEIKKNFMPNDIILSCQKEVENMKKELIIDRSQIINNFLKVHKTKRKKM